MTFFLLQDMSIPRRYYLLKMLTVFFLTAYLEETFVFQGSAMAVHIRIPASASKGRGADIARAAGRACRCAGAEQRQGGRQARAAPHGARAARPARPTCLTFPLARHITLVIIETICEMRDLVKVNF